jgi:hypothetical protein
LTLSDINPSVVMFTDRPARSAEAIPTAAFIKDWGIKGKNGFMADPPNAA